MFNIFFISTNKTHPYLTELKSKFVFARHADTILDAQKKSLTKMFWVVWDDLVVLPEFNFDYAVASWDEQYVHSFKNADDTYFGISLMPKDRYISSKEIEYRTFLDKKEVDIVASSYRKYDIFEINSYDDYLQALKNSTTDLFWMTGKNIKSTASFKFDLTFHDRYNKDENHAFLHDICGTVMYDGIFLLSKNKKVSKREIESRFLVNKKEWNILASTNKPYDIFEIDSYDDYLQALKNSTTDLFWMSSSKIKILPEFDMNFYFENRTDKFVHDRNNNHVFLHDVCGDIKYDGLFLLSKNAAVSRREIESRFLVNKKEWDIIASTNKLYDIFEIDSYDDYLNALTNTSTELFWMTGKNIKPVDTFKFNLSFRVDDQYNRTENHAFLHDICGTVLYDGIFLLSKNKEVSRREIETRFLVSKKEWDIVASTNKPYDIFEIDSYDDYLHALENASTELFWMSSSKIKILSEFDLNLYFETRTDKFIHDRNNNHAFLHDMCGTALYDGLFLLSKHTQVSKREIETRFLVSKKEWDIVASTNKPYDIFKVDTYSDYLHALEHASTELFWVIPSEVSILPEFDLNLYFETRTDIFLFDRTTHHSFKHKFRDELNFNGVNLVTPKFPLSEKEINYRFVINSKRHETVASKLAAYDIIFISYNESTADENFAELIALYPNAKRIHGVKGIHQAHIQAAQIAETEMFWVVDGDAKIVNEFTFNYQVPVWNYNTVHVWKSRNPINDLVYGYGGVKLLPRKLTLQLDLTTTDMTTSISKEFKVIEEVSNITAFNTDPFNTWKSAFRECVKLSSKVIDRQLDVETIQRLEIWKTVAHGAFAEYSIKGAIDAEKFVAEGNDLSLINDFDYLQKLFNK